MLTMIMMTAGQRHLVVNTNIWMKEITQLLSVLLLIMMIMIMIMMMMIVIDVNNDNDDCRSETPGGEHQHVDEGDRSAVGQGVQASRLVQNQNHNQFYCGVNSEVLRSTQRNIYYSK